jgi:hypothetical protein
MTGLEYVMQQQPFTHYLPLLIGIIAGTTLVIAIAVRLLFRRGKDALDP